jgi:hypothetical protein
MDDLILIDISLILGVDMDINVSIEIHMTYHTINFDEN